MKKITCFWLEPTDRVLLQLRRYVSGQEIPCSNPFGYHNAIVSIGEAHNEDYDEVIGDNWAHDDYRWPNKCSCGYQFGPHDEWQFYPTKLYKRSDTGELVTQANAPVGAMMNAVWLHGLRGYRLGTDGIVLSVKTPDGWWCVDGPQTKKKLIIPGTWRRTGQPDKDPASVSVTPSIQMTNYHGWLTNGELTHC